MKYSVFVYGTLRKGGSNHFRMKGAEFVGAGKVIGAIYRIDWIPGLIFPAYIGEEEGRVVGEIYRVDSVQLKALDEFEGISDAYSKPHEYRRVETSVKMDSGDEEVAWIWEWNLPLREAEQLVGGDWLKHEPNPS